ncbi:hypothetical protein H4696_009761 [Amycolatopsis lexingtonensis]|uniref:Uncharacterized protein n=1 Tax=Amycolatopsis lexingtonensis TaxID=218822 RepID=A0ABR9IHJ5_9PSEU|nr:hypothetical protein [Amycolatopsis lexingtonensis]MBE1502661.1 hypothetical protein [Amycolatopsis lexingtonensis]
MTDRLFIPAPFFELLATMPPATAIREDRAHWLDVAYHTAVGALSGPHGLTAMRLARVFKTALRATYDESAAGPSALEA